MGQGLSGQPEGPLAFLGAFYFNTFLHSSAPDSEPRLSRKRVGGASAQLRYLMSTVLTDTEGVGLGGCRGIPPGLTIPAGGTMKWPVVLACLMATQSGCFVLAPVFTPRTSISAPCGAAGVSRGGVHGASDGVQGPGREGDVRPQGRVRRSPGPRSMRSMLRLPPGSCPCMGSTVRSRGSDGCRGSASSADEAPSR